MKTPNTEKTLDQETPGGAGGVFNQNRPWFVDIKIEGIEAKHITELVENLVELVRKAKLSISE